MCHHHHSLKELHIVLERKACRERKQCHNLLFKINIKQRFRRRKFLVHSVDKKQNSFSGLGLLVNVLEAQSVMISQESICL